MTLFDCFCLMNDIRCWGQRDKARGDKHAQIEASELEPIGYWTFSWRIENKENRDKFLRELDSMGLLDQLLEQAQHEEDQARRLARDKYTPKQLEDIRQGKLKINGGRRKTRRKKKRKTKRRRKKRRKSTKKLKLRLTKHRKKRLKKWKVKKTRKN
jgi:hypothetical protein